MEGRRRSDRLRNRNRTLPIIESTQMAGDGSEISFNENEVPLNPHMTDETDSLFLEVFSGITNRRRWLLKCLELMIIIWLFITVLFAIEYITFLISNNDNLNTEYINYYPLVYSPSKLIKIERQINQLKRKLKVLSNGLEKTNKWRHNVKNEILQLTFNEFKKFNVKMQEALSLYDADKVGKTDYALESAGGYIISTPETTPFPSRFSYNVMGIINIQYPSNPRMLIQPETLPGQCFAFKGTHGKVRIGLAHAIYITSVTLEHAHPNLVDDITSAPKDFKVYALEGATSDETKELGCFTFKAEKRALQTYDIEETNKIKERNQYVELEILSNHGNPDYTCIYRFRVHGN